MNPDDENERRELPKLGEVERAETVAESSTLRGMEGGARGGGDVQAYIGRQLRAVYDDVVKQPIPERFLALMQQLEGQTPET